MDSSISVGVASIAGIASIIVVVIIVVYGILGWDTSTRLIVLRVVISDPLIKIDGERHGQNCMLQSVSFGEVKRSQ